VAALELAEHYDRHAIRRHQRGFAMDLHEMVILLGSHDAMNVTDAHHTPAAIVGPL
jgi:hypothetical protein